MAEECYEYYTPTSPFQGFFAGLTGNFIAVPKCKEDLVIGCGGWLDISFLGAGLINKKRNWYVGLEGGPSITHFCKKTITLAHFGLQCGFLCGQQKTHLIYLIFNMIGAPVFATANFFGLGYGVAINDVLQLRAEFTLPCSATFVGFTFPLVLPTARFKLGLFLKLF